MSGGLYQGGLREVVNVSSGSDGPSHRDIRWRVASSLVWNLRVFRVACQGRNTSNSYLGEASVCVWREGFRYEPPNGMGGW